METAARRLDVGSDGQSMTPDEFDAVDDYDDCYRYELVNGVVSVAEWPECAWAVISDELSFRLLDHAYGDPAITALDATLPNHYIATPGTRRLVDRAIWCGLKRRPNPRRDVPTIAADFVSARTRNRRDYVEKRDEYRAAGVKEYWIVDRFRRQMTVAFADGTTRVVAEGETYATPLLPGFKLPLAALLARSDAWGDEG